MCAYYPYVEPETDADKGLLAAFAERACVIVTDEFPSFLPRMIAAVAPRLSVKLEQVDSNGLLPLRATERVFTTAHCLRISTEGIADSFAAATAGRPDSRRQIAGAAVAACERHATLAARVGQAAGRRSRATRGFTDRSFGWYCPRSRRSDCCSQTAAAISQELSGAIRGRRQRTGRGCSQRLVPVFALRTRFIPRIVSRLVQVRTMDPAAIGDESGGPARRVVGCEPRSEAWLDQFITWRELGYNMSAHRDDYDRYESLPEWARSTLAKHARDRRLEVYSLEEFTAACTQDPLWNAAQNQLVREGRIQNYLRMLWGKKILEWTASPREALEIMIELNNRFAIDGRNPNSYSGIFWCLGRYDRAWGPERPIFGTVRYMSSDNTRRKLNVREYLRKYGDA